MICINITAPTTEVLTKLKANRAQHADIVKEAREGYLAAAKKTLAAKMQQLLEGKIVALSFSLSPPQDYTKEYDTAIAMLELHKNAGQDTIELSATDVQQFVMDEWDWAQRFLVSNAVYSARSQAMTVEKGYGQ